MRGKIASMRNLVLGIKVFALIGGLWVAFFMIGNVKAEIFSWTASPPTVAEAITSEDEPWNCEFPQKVQVDGETQQKEACITSGGSVRFGMTDLGQPLVSFGYDQKMYKLLGFCSGHKNCQYLPQTDTLIAAQSQNSAYNRVLKVYKNFSSNVLKRVSENGASFEYIPKSYQANYTFTGSLTNPLAIGYAYDSYGVSENEKWLVLEARARGLFRLDLEDFSLKRFSTMSFDYSSGSQRPWVDFAVSNDGQQAVMNGNNVTVVAFSILDTCGDTVTDQEIQQGKYLAQECPKQYLRDIIRGSTPTHKHGLEAEFTDNDAGELRLYSVGSEPRNNAWVTLRAAGYQPVESQLDYLALGDSYSSGEGDTALTSTGQKYYLAHTDENGDYTNGIPREKCHQSWRAWPFLLADHYNIPVGERFETVACSGAQIEDISANGLYEGQNDRLKGMPNIATLKIDALKDFIPGRERQLKFVRKYQPKVVTVGIGGNDIGFSKKLEECIAVVLTEDTCKYASTSEGKATVGKEISNQYQNLVELYTQLHIASKKTKIYAIGYPKPISTGTSCGNNVRLSYDERYMAERIVEYLNKITESAAENAGVTYVNVEDALNSRRLCDTKNPYVSGIAFTGKNELQESFHPNYRGQNSIAQYIKQVIGSETLISYSHCTEEVEGDFCPDSSVIKPQPNTYFAESMGNIQKNTQSQTMTSSTVSKNQPQPQKTESFTLKPNSTVKRTLHSDPIDLGDAIVGDDGSLDTTFTIPNNTPVGYHTLIIEGETYSGEPIELTQTILVTSSNPDDLDENNILDSQQHCGAFLEASNQDQDFDGIDDACDPEIEDTKPYRVRNGDEVKNENPNHIYIERNKNAASVTNISGDSDPDEDGWAIVAQSTTDKNSGRPANFWIDEQNAPHVSIRTSYNGCVQFTPRSLKVVKPNKLRKLKVEAKNINTCRSQQINEDTDNDGTADNQQTLYSARNGSVINNEDSNSIYLERNSVAAEAQLGISDYSYANSWNLLASSKSDANKEIFVKMIMVTNENGNLVPTILTNQIKTNAKGKTTITCIALQPPNTNVITINNQDRKLKKVPIPQGEGCD